MHIMHWYYVVPWEYMLEFFKYSWNIIVEVAPALVLTYVFPPNLAINYAKSKLIPRKKKKKPNTIDLSIRTTPSIPKCFQTGYSQLAEIITDAGVFISYELHARTCGTRIYLLLIFLCPLFLCDSTISLASHPRGLNKPVYIFTRIMYPFSQFYYLGHHPYTTFNWQIQKTENRA